jgi:hypothetical protein
MVYLSRLYFHPSNHNHDTKYDFMYHSVPVFSHALSIHESMQCFIGTQLNQHTARRLYAPKLIIRVENALKRRQL